ncbi:MULTISPECIES: helix-turn-helix domain-containing protein [Hyphobacterium]|uniref:Helix-turn-helix domain-containing protein n=1 Tax=Hyphobacterium vulgare TaxID=1736751 RepID=A0ABV6ZVX9_9PROT
MGWGAGPWLDLALAVLALALALRLACLGGFPDRRLAAWKWTGCSILALFGLVDMATAFELWPVEVPSQSNALAAGLALLVGGLVYLAFLSLHQSGPLAWLSFAHRVQPVTDDTALRIEAFMQRDQPWKDPDLTLARLARRLTLTQRQLSGYINIRHAMGFRQWLGTYRIEEAKRLMRVVPRRPLVELMLDAGFQTRSSFNKVFKDITGQTPSEWRRQALATPAVPAAPAPGRGSR